MKLPSCLDTSDWLYELHFMLECARWCCSSTTISWRLWSKTIIWSPCEFPEWELLFSTEYCGSSARRILQWQSDIEALSKLGSILTASSRSVPPGLKRDFRGYQRFQSHLITRGFYSSWSSYGFNIQDLFTSMRLNIVWCIIGLWFP